MILAKFPCVLFLGFQLSPIQDNDVIADVVERTRFAPRNAAIMPPNVVLVERVLSRALVFENEDGMVSSWAVDVVRVTSTGIPGCSQGW